MRLARLFALANIDRPQRTRLVREGDLMLCGKLPR
jgi:hypothetical protein